MSTFLESSLSVLATAAGCFLGILLAMLVFQELCIVGIMAGVKDEKIWVGRDGFVDVEAEECVCAGYRDVEAE
jgi:hypothetical protein